MARKITVAEDPTSTEEESCEQENDGDKNDEEEEFSSSDLECLIIVECCVETPVECFRVLV